MDDSAEAPEPGDEPGGRASGAGGGTPVSGGDGGVDQALLLVSELLVGSVGNLTDGEVVDALVGVAELAGRVDAVLARLTDSFDTRGLGVIDGARSTATWLANRTELARPHAHALVGAGRVLRACPVVDEAASSGRLGTAKVRLLAEAWRGVEELFAEHESELVGWIAPLTVAQARTVLERWRLMALASTDQDDGPEPAGDPSRNTFTCSQTFQGRWHLNGDVDAVTGAALSSMLEKWIDEGMRAGAITIDQNKPRAAHRADALAALTTAGATAAPGAAQARAQVTLSWDADDMLGKPVSDLADIGRRRCLLDGGTSLARSIAEQAMCNADVTDLLVRFGLDGSRHILGATHTRRHPTRRERVVLDQRDQGCVFPGCDAPARWCHAHHTVPYEIGKRTRLDELVLLCPHHHRAVHNGFVLSRSVTGQIRVARPDGTELSGAPPDTPPDVVHGLKIPFTSPRTRFADVLTRRPRPLWADQDQDPFDPIEEARMDLLIQQRIRDLGRPDAA